MSDRQVHPATSQILRHFAWGHLPPELAAISERVANLAYDMVEQLDGPELTAGLRKLLEAKDCFVRAAVEQQRATDDTKTTGGN